MDSHVLPNDAQPLSDDIKMLQQLMSITFVNGASQFTRRKSFGILSGQHASTHNIENSDTNNSFETVYYNHRYDSALVIDSILLGGSEYYTLSRDCFGNFVIDIDIDETLVKRSPTDDSDGKRDKMSIRSLLQIV